ncbi:MAG: hypothetical protein IKN55_12115 [Oscillospiraceae bacterium]|nr:hypothetical protein [Oscillospiraceae bacterium]
MVAVIALAVIAAAMIAARTALLFLKCICNFPSRKIIFADTFRHAEQKNIATACRSAQHTRQLWFFTIYYNQSAILCQGFTECQPGFFDFFSGFNIVSTLFLVILTERFYSFFTASSSLSSISTTFPTYFQ